MTGTKTSPELWIVGGTVLTMDPRGTVIPDGVVKSVSGKITSVVARDAAGKPPAGTRVLSAENCLVLPGLINGHTHVGMSLLRGIADDLPFDRWLSDYIFPVERKWCGPEFVQLGTQLACLEMIRGGVTTVNDMYYYHERVACATHEAGMRLLNGPSIVEIGDVEKSGELLEKFDRYLEAVTEFPLVRPVISPHSVYAVSQGTLEKTLAYVKSKGLALHLHLSETEKENVECQAKYGMSPTEFFESLGVWEVPCIAAHGVCLSPRDMEILAKRRVGVIHNPESNLKLGTQICKVTDLRRAGVAVGIGTDGVSSNNNLDLFQEVDTAAKLQSYQSGPGALTAYDAVKMLTIEGARAVHLDSLIGSLEVGKSADFIAVSLDAPHAHPVYEPYSHLVYSAQASDVRHTVVYGHVLMEDRKMQTLDESSILREVRSWQQKIAPDAKHQSSQNPALL